VVTMVRQSKPGRNSGRRKRFASDDEEASQKQAAFVLESLLAGRSAAAIIGGLNGDKEDAAARMLALIHSR
jgi:uncharacterized protein (DUF2141 family)